jgi:hypothetical protein
MDYGALNLGLTRLDFSFEQYRSAPSPTEHNACVHLALSESVLLPAGCVAAKAFSRIH